MRRNSGDEIEYGRVCLNMDMKIIETIKIEAIKKRVSLSRLVETILKEQNFDK